MEVATRLRREEQGNLCHACARPRFSNELLSIALAVLFFAHAAHAGQVAAPSAKEPKGGLPTLTTARQAHSLSEVEAARAYPVHLQGVVTYYDPDFGTGLAATFIHDATGSIFVSQTSELARQLFVGALVDVRGVSAPGGFGPIVKNPRIRVLGRAPLPPHPPRVSLAILKTGAYDAQWVEVEGSVHQLIEYAHAVVLNIEMMDGPIAIIIGTLFFPIDTGKTVHVNGYFRYDGTYVHSYWRSPPHR